MGIIYKYTSPSGKSYIGQTKQSITQRRKDSNGSGYMGCTSFYHAIQKYGLKNFILEILEEVEDEKLNEREQYYIAKFNTQIPNGYNLTKGGDYVYDVSKPVKKYNLEKKCVAEYSSLTEAAEENNCSIGAISEVCSGRKATLLNHYWAFDGETPKFKQPKRKIVYQFDIEGNLIKEFESANNADRYYNLPMGTIKQCANKNQKRKRVNGFIFTYEPFIDKKYYL